MKVLFITRLYPNELNSRNGAVMHKQALELKNNGIEVEVISPIPIVPKFLASKRKKWNEYYNLPSIRFYEGIKVWHPKYIDLPFKSFDSFRGKALIKSFESMLQNSDFNFEFNVIHSHMAFPDSSLGVYLKEKYGVPLITTLRSTDMMISVNNRKIKKILNKNFYLSDQIIAPSPQLSKRLWNEFNYESIHIGNGIYPYPVKKQNKSEYKNGVYANKLILLSVSQLISWKGIQQNIRAMKSLIPKHPDLIYLIVGDGPEYNYLKELVNNLNLKEYIFFLGELSHEKSLEYISLCDIFSMPSYRETFGLVYLESMYLKKPIILCNDNGIDGIVSHKESAMIVPPKDVKFLIESIDLLLTDNKLYEKVSINGYNIMIEKYLWDQIGIQLVDTYKSCEVIYEKNNKSI